MVLVRSGIGESWAGTQERRKAVQGRAWRGRSVLIAGLSMDRLEAFKAALYTALLC